MPFDIPTLPALIGRAQGDLAGSSALLRSDAEVLARVQAGASYGRYGHQAHIAQQILPDTADEETLQRMARIRLKRDRLSAVAATGMAAFSGAPGAFLDAGTLLQREDGMRMRVSVAVALTGSVGLAKLESLETGQLGNTPAGSKLRLVSPVLGVSDSFVVTAEGMTGGTDQESIETLRARLIRSYKVVPHGGNKDDYKTWALEVPGVTRAWVRRHWMGPGSVAVFIARDGDIDPIPSPAELQAAFSYIEVQRPVTAEVGVFAPIEKPIQYQIKLTPDSGVVRASVEAALIDLHSREADLGEPLLLTHIRESISGAAGERDHQLLSPLSNVQPGASELPTFGGILWV